MRLARSDRPCRLHARCMSRCLASDPHATDATSGHEWEDLRKSLAVLTAQCRHAIYIAIRVSPQMQMRNFAKLWPGGGGGKSRCRYYHGSRQQARYWFAIGFLLSTLPVLVLDYPHSAVSGANLSHHASASPRRHVQRQRFVQGHRRISVWGA